MIFNMQVFCWLDVELMYKFQANPEIILYTLNLKTGSITVNEHASSYNEQICRTCVQVFYLWYIWFKTHYLDFPRTVLMHLFTNTEGNGASVLNCFYIQVVTNKESWSWSMKTSLVSWNSHQMLQPRLNHH